MGTNQDYSSANLVELRKRAGFSRREFLEKLEAEEGVKLHPTTLRRIEDGEQPMKVPEALAVSSVFGIDLDDFVAAPIRPEEALIRGVLGTYEERETAAVNALLSFRTAHRRLVAVLEDPELPAPNQSQAARMLAETIETRASWDEAVRECLVAIIGERLVDERDTLDVDSAAEYVASQKDRARDPR